MKLQYKYQCLCLSEGQVVSVLAIYSDYSSLDLADPESFNNFCLLD